jgi:decaprenylphospho-beta-D-ribofuranose 2-oxidase
MAFDTQALTEGVVIQLSGFDAIGDVVDGTITVGANAAWGNILEKTRRAGYVPYVMVTTERATAGGTLSSDCLSRFSPTCGKEGNHVERFKLMNLDGEVVECSRENNADLFSGVISGFGCLGIVLEVTYRLLYVGYSNIVVETVFTPFTGLSNLAHELVTAVGEVRGQRDERAPTRLEALRQVRGEDARAISCVVTLGADRRGFVMRSRYVDGAHHPLKPSPFHEPKSLVQRTLQLLAMFPGPRHIGFWLTLHWFLARRTVSIDALQGFTFFEGGNDAVRTVLRKLSFPAGIRQQTFVIPLVANDPDDTKQKLADFLVQAEKILVARNADPTLIDVLYLPDDADEDFALSSNHGLSGYAVTLTFEDLRSTEFAKEDAALREISTLCLGMGGRVHLVKNVIASPDELSQMYSWGIEKLRGLKKTYDPTQMLSSSFLRRVLPALGR